MAIAKKCDICDKLYESYNMHNSEQKCNGFMYLNIDRYSKYFTHKAKDCCPECMESIKNYIESLKVKEI